MAGWNEFGTIGAPSPDDKSGEIVLSVSQELIDVNCEMNKMTPLLQLWCHVYGVYPPLPNIIKVENATNPPTLLTLSESTACFRGVNRPHDDEDNGDSVVCFVINPTVSIEFCPSMVCLAQPVDVPQNVALTVLVRINPALLVSEPAVDGIITRIEPVKCSVTDPLLPDRHETRYGERLW